MNIIYSKYVFNKYNKTDCFYYNYFKTNQSKLLEPIIIWDTIEDAYVKSLT